MRHYPLLKSYQRTGTAITTMPRGGAPQYKRPRSRAQKMPSCGAFGQPSLSSDNNFSTANIQINFNTVCAPAHFFSIFRRFCARRAFRSGATPPNKFQYRVLSRTLFFNFQAILCPSGPLVSGTSRPHTFFQFSGDFVPVRAFGLRHQPDAHFFSIFRRFCARQGLWSPAPAGRKHTNKFQYRVLSRTLFFNFQANLCP